MSIPPIENVTPGEYRYQLSGIGFITNPIEISNLDGDLYDYTNVLFAADTSTGTSYCRSQLNGFFGTAYRRYQMAGSSGTTVSAFDSDVNPNFITNMAIPSSTPGLTIARFTGGNGVETKGHFMTGSLFATTAPIVLQGYMSYVGLQKITDLHIQPGFNDTTIILHPRLYRTSKVGNMRGCELIKEVSISARDIFTSPLIFGGGSDNQGVSINGELHGEYVVEVDLDGPCSLRFNGDSGSNYLRQELVNTNGALSSVQATDTQMNVLDYGVATISASKAHGYRVVDVQSSRTTSNQQGNKAYWWTNAADTLTSISVTYTSSSNRTGKIRIWRKQPHGSFDGLPWEKVGRHEFNGSFSGGYTFSNLNGNDTYLYKVKTNFVRATGDGLAILEIRPNNDILDNHKYQDLAGRGAVAAATGSDNPTPNYTAKTYSINTVAQSETYIYPKSGTMRPMLTWANYETSVDKHVGYSASWWKNTADNITSINVGVALSTDLMEGYLELYRLPL